MGKRQFLEKKYEDFGYEIYSLGKSMQPNDTLVMELKVTGSFNGFPNEGSGSDIVYNGTFFK